LIIRKANRPGEGPGENEFIYKHLDSCVDGKFNLLLKCIINILIKWPSYS